MIKPFVGGCLTLFVLSANASGFSEKSDWYVSGAIGATFFDDADLSGEILGGSVEGEAKIE